MKITQIQYFNAVCRYGSISKAADTLHISQPSVSTAIKELENEFRVNLFKRTNKHLSLTSEGMYFYQRTSDILSQFDALEQQMFEMGRNKKRIILAIPPISGMHLFSTLADEFFKQRPEINFEIKQCFSSECVKMLIEGLCDLAIVVDNGNIPSELECALLLSSEIVYCVSPDHPFAEKKQIKLADLQNEQLILNQDDSYMTIEIKKRFFNLGLVPNVLLYAVQLPLIIEFLNTGKIGTFLIKELAETLPGFVAIPLEDPITINFMLLWGKNKYNWKNVADFINHAKNKRLCQFISEDQDII